MFGCIKQVVRIEAFVVVGTVNRLALALSLFEFAPIHSRVNQMCTVLSLQSARDAILTASKLDIIHEISPK